MLRDLRWFSRAGMVIVTLALVYVIGRTVVTAVPTTVAQGAKGGWLGRLAPDAQIDALDRQLRGFDMAMLEALKQKSPTLFQERFTALRAACNACHVAESVPFIQVGIPTVKQTPLVHN